MAYSLTFISNKRAVSVRGRSRFLVTTAYAIRRGGKNGLFAYFYIKQKGCLSKRKKPFSRDDGVCDTPRREKWLIRLLLYQTKGLSQ